MAVQSQGRAAGAALLIVYGPVPRIRTCRRATHPPYVGSPCVLALVLPRIRAYRPALYPPAWERGEE